MLEDDYLWKKKSGEQCLSVGSPRRRPQDKGFGAIS